MMLTRVLRLTVPALLLAVTAAGQSGYARVERVIDGDTTAVQGVGTVWLIGVDTPETVDPRKPVEFFGKEASEFTRRLVGGKQVRLEYDWQRKDKYDRTLAYIYLPDGTFVNAEIVRQGYGHAYTQYPFKYLDQFRAFEREARQAGRGLWAGGTAPSSPTVAQPQEDQENITVYVTRTGEKYHRTGCRYLARSQIPLPLKEAAARYGPCSVCRPPVLKAPSSGTAAEPLVRPRAGSPMRCQAVTRQGTQCKRMARPGSRYCWQHGG